VCHLRRVADQRLNPAEALAEREQARPADKALYRRESAFKLPSASGQRNAGRWLAGARFLQVLNWVQFGIREGFWQG